MVFLIWIQFYKKSFIWIIEIENSNPGTRVFSCENLNTSHSYPILDSRFDLYQVLRVLGYSGVNTSKAINGFWDFRDSRSIKIQDSRSIRILQSFSSFNTALYFHKFLFLNRYYDRNGDLCCTEMSFLFCHNLICIVFYSSSVSQ